MGRRRDLAATARRRHVVVASTLAGALVLAACGGGGSAGSAPQADAGSSTSAVATTEAPTSTVGSGGGPTSTSVAPAPQVDLAEWQTLEITDVDGETFTIAELAGRPVFVEAFATWCSNCRRQLGDTQDAAAELGDEAVVLALSVETSLSPGDVASYAEEHGFTDIRFAVMSPELLAAMVDALGGSVANPPSVPHVTVAADGSAGELSTGYVSAGDLVADLRAVA